MKTMNSPTKAFCLTALASTGILAITTALFRCSDYFHWQWDWRIKAYCGLAAYVGLIGLIVAYILALKHQVAKGAAIFGAVGCGMIALSRMSYPILSSRSAEFGCGWLSLILLGIESVGYVLVAISFVRMPRTLHVVAKVAGLIGAGYKALLGIAWLVFRIRIVAAQGGYIPEAFFYDTEFYRILVQFTIIPDAVASILLVVPFAVMLIAKTQLGGMQKLNAWCAEAGRVFCTSCGNEVAILPGQMSAVCMKCGVPVSRNTTSLANGSTNTTGWFSFSGRARRREYWAKIVKAIFFALLAAALSFVSVLYSNQVSTMLALVSGAVSAVVIVGVLFGLVLPVTVRRLHDRNMSGWWVLLFWLLSSVPFVGWIVSIVQFVIVGCLEGTVGPNQFGADPKEKEHAALLRGLNAAQASNDAMSHGAQSNPGAQSEVSVRLRMLQDLRAQGLISDTEYEEKRSKVLETV